MKNRLNVWFPLIFGGLVLLVAGSCKKNTDDTSISLPSIITKNVTSVMINTAECGGSIVSDGGLVIIKKGVCWSTNEDPSINGFKTNDGEGAGTFVSKITGLKPNTKYFLKAYATTSNGTSYGALMPFTTVDAKVKDIDNNEYKTIQIGNQIWMAENLRTSRYNVDKGLYYPGTSEAWYGAYRGAYAWYDNLSTDYEVPYGKLYNWFAVDSGALCPTGWHVPTGEEWDILTNYLGGSNLVGGKLKESGNDYWNMPNAGAINSTGFKALAGGWCDLNWASKEIGEKAYFWTASPVTANSTLAYYRSLSANDSIVFAGSCDKKFGCSVRCVKN